MSDGQSTRSTSRSRQERIRDNQRRSRARKQEYLTDLERRLSESQQSSREADLQRATLIELQIENARLRELLNLAGVSEAFTETYVAQANPWTNQLHGNTPGLRRLRPNLKLLPTGTDKDLSNSMLGTPHSGQSGGYSGLEAGLPSNDDMEEFEQPSAFAPYNSLPPNQVLGTEDADKLLGAQGQFSQLFEPPQPVPASRESFFCEVFQVKSEAVPGPADENTILCWVAKQMLDLYDIPAPEMEQVRAKLAHSFRQPAVPESGCGVDNQVLFKVLNDLSAKYN